MRARIVDNHWLCLENVTPDQEAKISKHFSAIRPGAVYVDPDNAGAWDGVYRRYSIARKRMNRAFLGELRALCADSDYPLVVLDDRPAWPHEILPPEAVGPDFLPGITLEEYQIGAIRKGIKCEVGIFKMPMGSGKCLGRGTPVLMYDGTIKLVQDIRPGDLLMGDDSTPRTVLSICSGRDRMYEVSQKNGDAYVVNSAHILSLMRTPESPGHKRAYEIVDLPVSDFVGGTNWLRNLHKGYKVAVDFPDQPTPPFDPYLLGVWLGDGISADLQFCLAEETDRDILVYLRDYCATNGYVLVKYPDDREAADIYAIRLYEGVHKPANFDWFTRNELKQYFKALDLFNNKHIPLVFKCGSAETRLQVLAGLVDAEGDVSVDNDTLTILMKRGRIPKDLVFLARSLGFRVTYRERWKECTTTKRGDLYAAVCISGNISRIPVKVAYKRARARRTKKNPLVCGISVRYVGRGQYYGFELDGNKRFLLGDFTVTHNTEVIAGLCKAIKCPTVILADQLIIIDQIKARLELREVVAEAGLFYAGQTPSGQPVIIGSVQSLVIPSKVPEKPVRSNYKDDAGFKRAVKRYEASRNAFRKRSKRARIFQDIVRAAGMLIIDECDAVAVSESAKYIFRYLFRGRRRYGMSGTPEDPGKPVQNLFLKEHLGSIIYEIDRTEVEARGRTVPVEYTMVAFDHGGHPEEASAFDLALQDLVVNNKVFHDLVAGLQTLVPEDCGTLILVERDTLGEALAAAIPGSRFIHGKTPKRRRNETLRAFERREFRVLIGGKIMRRGVDLSGGCEYMILATGGKIWANIKQQAGRATRVNKQGVGKVFDFYFLNNRYLYEHSRSRLKAMVDLGYKTRVIFRNGEVDGAQFVKSRFRIPKGFNR